MKRLITLISALLVLGLAAPSWGADATGTLSYKMYDRDGTYNTARDNGDADSNSSGGCSVGQKTTFDVIRGYMEFPIPALSSVASCYLYTYGDADNSTTDFDIELFTGSWISMATSQWDAFDGWTAGSAHTGTNLAESWNTSSFSVGWNIIELNAAGRAAILAAQGTTIKIAMVSAEDVSRSEPTGDEYVSFESIASAGEEPFLRITETAAADATLEGVTLQGVSVNPPAPVQHWPLLSDLVSITGINTGTFTHAGVLRTRVHPITGLITDVPANTARFESEGLLIEPAGTNLCTHSHEFRAAISNWEQIRCTVTDDATTGPDGSVTADKLVEATDVGQSYYTYTTIAKELFTDNASVTFSIYAKSAERTWVRLSIGDKDGDYPYAFFNLATGAVGTERDVDSYGSEPAANGFYRYWITQDIGSGANDVFPYLTISPADTTYSYNGVAGNGIYVWGAQIEESPVPTSYIATSGAAVTRATESGEPHFTLPTGLFDDKGTAIVWWRPGYGYAILTDYIRKGIVSVDNDARFIGNASTGTTGYTITSDTSAQILSQPNNWAANTWYKLVVKWGYSVGGVKKFRVGVDSGTGVSWGPETTFDGAYTTGANLVLGYGLFSRMHLRNLRLFKDVLTDEEIDRE